MHATSVSITLSLDRDASGAIRVTADCPDFAMRAIADGAARALADLAGLVETSPRAREWVEDVGSGVVAAGGAADDASSAPPTPAPSAAPDVAQRPGSRRRA
jgi:hypothetical protein